MSLQRCIPYDLEELLAETTEFVDNLAPLNTSGCARTEPYVRLSLSEKHARATANATTIAPAAAAQAAASYCGFFNHHILIDNLFSGTRSAREQRLDYRQVTSLNQQLPDLSEKFKSSQLVSRKKRLVMLFFSHITLKTQICSFYHS